MKKITFLLMFIATVTFSHAQNKIDNGNFERELQSWSNIQGDNASSATFFVEKRNTFKGFAMKTVVLRLGRNDWDIQSVVPAYTKRKKKYRLTFYGRTRTSGISVRAVIQKEESESKEFKFTTEWTKFTWEFKALENEMELKFQYLNKGTFYLDEVDLEQIK